MNFKAIKVSLVVLIFIGLIVLFVTSLGRDKNKLPSQFIDKPAPEFLVNDLLMVNQRHSQKMFIGKITLINLWASWCPSCYDEHAFWKDYANTPGVTVIGLNYKDKKDKALNFLQTQGNPYQAILYDDTGRLGIEFGVYGAPETFLVDQKGNIRAHYPGPVTPQVFAEKFLPVINQIKQNWQKSKLAE